MTLHWMAYCAGVGALLALAATAAEAALRAARLPTRGAWAAALALSLAVPAWAWWTPDAPPAAVDVVDSGGSLPVDLASVPVLDAAPTSWKPADLDRPLALAWGGASAAVLAALVALGGALHLRRRRWVESIVDGEPVLLSDDTGPAVIGWLRPRIVLPRWAADADPDSRALLMEHEREHLRAGDPRLLLLALAAVAALPFSPAAWWMLRRLRLAVEVDCDARVLARRGDLAAYGALLLEVGRRGGGAPLPLVAFSEGASNLERRIRIMTRTRRPAPALLALFGVMALGAASLAAAVSPPSVPLPVSVAPAADPPPAAAAAASPRLVPAAPADTVLPRIENAREVADAMSAGYPPLLRDAGVSGTVTVRIRLSAEGRVESARVLTASHPSFGDPALEALRLARFRPATVDGRPVPYALTLPLRFSLPRVGEGHAAPAEAPEISSAPDAAPAAAAAARALIERHMPEVAARGTSAAYVWFVTDATGAVVAHGDEASRDEMHPDPDAIESVEMFRGRSVVVNGHPVPVIWVRLKG